MQDFIKNLEIRRITDEIDTKYEATQILRKYPKETVILENLKGYDMPIISGICNTREKIGLSIQTPVSSITQKIIDAMESPEPISKDFGLDNYNTSEANLDSLPIIHHYKRDGGKYITAGVIVAEDPETGVVNASIHRMLVLGKDRIAVRLVPRHLYTYHQKAEKLGMDLNICICIGMNPSTLLATTTSIPLDVSELEVANYFQNGNMKQVTCDNGLCVPEADIILEGKILNGERADEGPFVDLTDTYDIVRKEPVIKLDSMHIKDGAYYHAILPAGNEHKLLQGLPQEPRIFKAVQNTLPTLQNVTLTEGGCCWLHAAISIKKQTQGDAKNVIMAALSAHPSLKHVVVVDDDVDIFDPEDIEYAIATRVKGDDDIVIVPGARGSSLDPVAESDGRTTKVGVDATKDLTRLDEFERVSYSE